MQQKFRRRLIGAFGAAVSSACLPTLAQQQSQIRRIGFIGGRRRSTPAKPDVYYDAFVQGMRELGYIEGKNLQIEWRLAEGQFERFPALAAEMAKSKVEVIVTHSSPAIDALRKISNQTPIVYVSMSDPIGGGYAQSLARPGGNITGLSTVSTDLIGKQLQLLKLSSRKVSRVAILVDPNETIHTLLVKEAREAAKVLGLTIHPLVAGDAAAIDRAFAAMKRDRVNGLLLLTSTRFGLQRRQIAELAVKHQLPSMYFTREYPNAGGLMSYGNNQTEVYRQGAAYVDKILKGAKPAELPIQQPTRFYLVINGKTAKALGLKISEELLLRADEVIE